MKGISTICQVTFVALVPSFGDSFTGLRPFQSFPTSLRQVATTSESAKLSSSSSSSSSRSTEEAKSVHPPLVLIDVENVRGKAHFKQSHEELIAKACSFGVEGSDEIMALVVDHGATLTVQTGGPLSPNTGVLFAGPEQKADDLIVTLARSSQNRTIVVSSDNEVVKLCRENSNVQAMDSNSFLERLNRLSSSRTLFGTPPPVDKEMTAKHLLQKEVSARQELQMVDRLLNPRRGNGRSQKNLSRKQRSKLQMKRERARERLSRIINDSIVQGAPTLQSVVLEGDVQQLESIVHGLEASKEQIRRGEAETTYERQILAERLRRQLEQTGALTIANIPGNNEVYQKLLEAIHQVASSSSAIATGQRFHNPDVRDASSIDAIDGAALSERVIQVTRHRKSETPRKPLRLVVISDTHGYEEQLFRYFDNTGLESAFHLPAADVLIHCGDFQGTGGKQTKYFDRFLAAQTHIPTKIVVRGNHDPRAPGRVLFPESKALYVTKPMTLELDGGVIIALRPHSRSCSEVLLPANCDIVASHEPPFRVLDYTYSGQRAGSIPLRNCIDSSATKPCLMLSGHIHEGRGAKWHTFYSKPPRPGTPEQNIHSTYVVNAANANSGKARRVVNGPVVIDLVDPTEEEPGKGKGNGWHPKEWLATEFSSDKTGGAQPHKIYRPDSLEALISESGSEDGGDDEAENARKVLLSVDLGLRTGTAVYDEEGTVLSVDSWRFLDHEDLKACLDELILGNDVTHVVIEGDDRKLYQVWKQAIDNYSGVKVARVVADDWRTAMLRPKERRSTRFAKQAAGLIAKQILQGTDHEGKKLSHDASEALLIGKYALRTMGWGDPSQPLVARYMNGAIVRH